jgi:hypothetical protein
MPTLQLFVALALPIGLNSKSIFKQKRLCIITEPTVYIV